jgi:hypothetical protein
VISQTYSFTTSKAIGVFDAFRKNERTAFSRVIEICQAHPESTYRETMRDEIHARRQIAVFQLGNTPSRVRA